MKRLVRFVLLTLGYLVAIVRVSARRLPKRASSSRNSRRRIGMLSGTGLALLGLVVAGNLLSPPASAVSIRSGSGGDSCTVNVGDSSLATISNGGDYCVVKVIGNTWVTFPAYISQVGIIVVGGGGGGGGDGGVGGGGGQVRYSSTQNVDAGGTVNVTIGAGGTGGPWGGYSGSGGSTVVTGAGISYTANGGAGGGNWQNSNRASGGSGGSGTGTALTGGYGAPGPINPQNATSNVVLGSVGEDGPAVSINGINTSNYGGGGGGGTCYDGRNASGTSVLGASGGRGGGGRGANYRYAVDGQTITNTGGSFGQAGFANTGGGGGGGMACDAYAANTNGTYQRNPGGAGGTGVAIFSWMENRTAVSQVPDGCFANLAEVCLQAAKIQLTNFQGSNIGPSGVTVTLAVTSAGSLNGVLSATTDSNGLATLGGFWITGVSTGTNVTLTFEAVGYRNIQTTITMMAYAEDLYVVPGSDSNGKFIGTTGIWLATASSSNVSAATLQSQLTARDVLLRASAANTSTSLGNISVNTGAVVREEASVARTLTMKATRNIAMFGSGRVTSSGQPLNVIIHTDSDGSNGGMVSIQGNSSTYPIEANGGSVAIGGGSSTMAWNSLTIPSSSSGGYGPNTGNWWGIQLGTATNIANNKLIYTNGGKIRLNGHGAAGSGVSMLYGIAWESGRIDAGSGDIEIIGSTSGSPSNSTGPNWGIGLGANNPTGNDKAVLVTSGTATLNGVYDTAGTSDYWGVYIGNSEVTTGSGGLNVTSTQRAIIAGSSTFTGTVNLGGTAPVVRGTNTFVGALNVTASAGDATLGGSQTLSTSGAALKVKATANVLVEANASIQTTRGRIVMWTRSAALESSTTQGYFSLDNGASIASNGGDIYIAGSSSTDANDLPAGHTYTNDSTNSLALKLGSNSGNAAVSINSGGGNIRMYGQTGTSAAHAMAVQSTTASTISAGGGRIDVHLLTSNTRDNVFEAWNGGLTVTSSASADAVDGEPAIKWLANQTSSSAGYNPIQSAGLVSMQATGGGDIDFTATSANTDVYAFDNTKNFQLLASSGQIRANFGANGLNLAGGIAEGFILGAVSGGSSSSNIVLTSNRLDETSPNSTASAAVFRTSGIATIQPTAQSFSDALALDGTWSFTGVTGVSGGYIGGLTIGQSGTGGTVSGATQNATNVTLSTAVTAAGPISIYGNTVTVDATLTTTTANSPILLKAAVDVLVSAGTSTSARRSLITGGSPITLWSNADATGLGKVQLGNYTELSSGAGAITLAGSTTATETSPSGYSTAGTGAYGVALGTGAVATDVVKLTSTSGDIVLRGKIQQTSALGIGVALWSGSNITSATGAITVDGQSYQPTGTAQGHATYLNLGGSYTSTITTGKSTDTAIDIKGIVTSGANPSTNAYGVLAWLSTGSNNISAPGGGDISIAGVGATNNTSEAIALNRTNLFATSGDITLNGGAKRVILGENGLNYIGGSTTAADHTGNLTICGGDVVFFTSYWTYLRTAGNLVIEPCSGSFTKAQDWPGADVSMVAKAARFGRVGNSAGITVSTSMTLTGDLEVIGGAVNYGGTGVTASGDASDVTITASGTFSGAAPFNAGGNITISSVAYSGTGALTAGGDVNVSAATYAVTGAVAAVGDANVTATGAFSGAGRFTTGGNVTISAAAFTGSGAIQASGRIAVTATTFDGTGALTSSGADGISVTTTAGDLDTGANMVANTSATAPITLKATGNILLSNNLTSAGGPITLWSDSDALNAGGIYTAAASTITSNGGAVTMSGGTNLATGFATATLINNNGIDAAYSGIRMLGKISSDAGDVVLRGKDNAGIGNLSHNAGIQFDKSFVISTTSGDVTILGVLANASSVAGSGNHLGVLMGYGGTLSTGTSTIKTVDGDISITGDGSTLIYERSCGLRPEDVTITSTNGDITLEGTSSSGAQYDIDWNGASVTSTNGDVLVKTGATNGVADFDITGAQISSNSSVKIQAYKPSFAILSLAGTGTKTIEPPTSATSFGADFTTTVATAGLSFSSSSKAMTLGSSTNSASVTLGKATSIAGPITVYGGDVTNSANLTATTATGSIAINASGTFTNSAAISSASGNQTTIIKAQKAAITGSINSGTAATQITGFNSARTINIGITNDTTDTLSLSDTELDTITAGTIRVGDATSGTITVSAAISITSQKSSNLALRTAGNVTATNNATISATNLGISAGGTISLGGSNGVTGNLALVAGGAAAANGANYGSSGNYSVAAVDGITPVFGVGKNISLTNVPLLVNEVRYLNQTWSAPPVVTIKDEYGYVLTTKNLKATTYTTDVTDSGAPSLAGTTAVVSGGTQTFSALNFTTTPGTTTLTFTTAGLAAGGTSSVTTGTYDVQGGEPASLSITYDATDAPAGKTGFGIKVTLKDVGGNTVSGPHATDAITVDVSDGDADSTNNATIVSGSTPSTVAGTANFSNLILGGKVGVSYTLTFTVTYVDTGSVTRTRSETQIVRLTHGDATSVKVQTAAAGFANRTNFSTQPAIAIKDAYDNTVTSSTASVSVAVSAVGATSTQGLTGTLSVNAASGVATFSGLGKTGLVGAKRLTYSASGLSSDTQDFTLTYGAAHHITPVVSSSLVNDTVFTTQPVVTIQDQDGNTVESSTATVTLTSGDATIGGTLLNSAVAMDAVAGVANFAGKNVKLTGTVGAKTLTATVAGLTAVDSTVTITYGAATKLAITRQAAGAVNGVDFTTQPQVTVQDVSGNPVTNSTATITVESSGSVLSGNSTPPTLVNGVATFSGLKLTGTKGTYVLTFKSTGLTNDFHSITVAYGAATKLILTTAPLGFVNRTNFTTQPVVTVQDASGNTVENASLSIDVSSDTNDLTGTLRVNVVNGIATFSGVGNAGKVGSKHLTFKAVGGGLSVATFDYTLTFGAATKLTQTTAAAGFVNRTDFTTQPVITVQDFDGNTVEDSTVQVTVAMSNAVLTGTKVVAAVNGFASFTDLGKTGTVNGTKTLSFTSPNLTGTSQAAFTMTHGAASSIQTLAGSNAVQSMLGGYRQSGIPFSRQPQVAIVDADGNIVNSGAESTQTVTASADQTGLSGGTTVTAVGGLATFQNLTMTAVSGNYVMTYTANTSGSIGTTPFSLWWGTATQLVLSTQVAGFENRTNFTTQPVITVKDSMGNTVEDSTISIDVTIDSGTLTGTTQVAAVAGVATFTNLGKYGTVGAKTITFRKIGLTTATQSFTLTYGAIHHLNVAVAGTLTNDTAWAAQPVVAIHDEDNNTVDTNDTVTLTASGATTVAIGGTTSMQAVNGVANFAGKGVKLTGLAGTKTLTAEITSGSGFAKDTSITLGYGVATKLALTTEPAGFVNRTNYTTQPVVTVQDVSGNTVANSSISIDVTIDTGDVTGTTRVRAVNGVATFAGLGKAGTVGSKTLTFKDAAGALTVATKQFTLTHGAAHHTTLAMASTLANDTEFATQPVVTLYDQDNNVVTSGSQSSQTVTLSVAGATTVAIGGTVSMDALEGVANFSGKGVKLTGLIGSKSLTASISSPNPILKTESVTITYGAATKLAISTDAADASNGSLFGTQPVILVQDVSGNLVANSTVQVNASVNNGTLDGTDSIAAVGGVATFTDLGLTASAGAKTLTFASTGLTSATQTITAVTGAPTQLRIDVANTLVNNTVFATQPVVTLLDATGNVVSAGNHAAQTVTLSSPDSTIGGTFSMQSVAGVANFTGQGVKLTGLVGARSLVATIANPNNVTATASVTITFGAAHHLNISSGAAGATSRVAFTSQPAIEVLDVSGNRVDDSTATISVTASAGNGATLGGDTSMGATSGIAYFNLNTNKLKLSGAVGSYTLTYASTGLTAASENISLTHGVATQIVLTQNAAGAKSGQAFTTQPSLEVRDADGNLVNTGVAATASIRVQTGSSAYDAAGHTGANLTGPASSDVVDAIAGVATFSGLRLEGVAASAYSLNFETVNTAGYNGIATTQNIALTAGTQTQLRVVEQPSDIVAGVAFATAVKAEILDAWNNRVLDVANTVTIKPTLVADALATTVIDASKTGIANSTGLVTFTGLTFTKAGTHYVQFTSTGLTAATSSSFVITNAAAHHLTWVTQPVGAKNDYAVKGAGNADPELEVRDQYQNPILVGAATTVDVTEEPSTTDVQDISGGTVVSDSNARVKFNNLVLRAKAGSYTLRFTATNGSLPINGTYVDSAAPVGITFGDPTALRLTRNAAGATSGAPFATQPKLNIEDSAGNIVADSALEVSVTETETQVLGGTRTLAATAGQVDFTGSGMMLSGSVATGLNLKYAITYNGTEISTTQTINLDPGLAVALTIGQQPTTVKTRVAFNPVPTVVLRDAAGNQVTSDSASTVTALLKDAGGNPVGAETSAFTASGGLVTFTGLSFQAPSTENYYVTFKLVSNSQAVTSNAFDILPGNATELRVTTAPSTLNQDQSLTMTGEVLAQQPVVKLYDQDGNLVTTTNTGSATIRVKSGAGGDLTAGSTTATYAGGIATFSGVKLIGTPGVDYVLEFTNPSPSLTSTASSAMRVVHNVADHLDITTAASGGKAGTRFSTQPVITVLDRYENVVTDGPGSDALVTANAAITAQGSTVLGTPLPISPSNAEVAAVNGVASFDSLTISGLVSNTYALTYSLDLAGIEAQTQSNITITYGSFNHLTIRTQPVGGNATGDALSVQPVIELRDGSENIVADPAVHSTLNASISSADGLTLLDNTLANPSLARLENASAVSNSGVVTFTQLKLLGLPGTSYTLKFAINTRFTTSTSVTVNHAAAHHLTITQQPTGGNATGENLAGQPIVQLRDRFENIVTSNSSDVVDARIATATGVSLTGNTTATLAAGVATFAGLKVIALPDTDYTLDFTTTVGANSMTSAPTNSFRVTYSTPAKLAMVQQPVGGTTGTALTTQPIVEVQDFYGNRVFNYSGSITAAVGGSGSTLTSASASDRSAVVANGRASFTDLALTATPATDYQLSFSAGSLVGVNSANVQVVPGAPVRIEILNQPIGAQTGAALAGQPVVRVVDTFGNLVTQDNSTVITAALTSGTGGTLSRVVSSQSVAITSTVSGGVATFSNLFMRGLTNHNYKLTFTSGSLVSAVSNDFTVSHAAVDRLIWETQPTVGMTGSPLTRAAVLELQDLDGNVATSDSTTVVTAAVTTGVGGALTYATATANQGVVTFTNLVLTGTPGVTYRLTFTGAIGGSTVTALESDGLVPVHAVPAKVTTRGGNVVGALSGENLASQPSLYVRDRFDNIATSDNSTVVTASILDDVTGSVSGNVTATAVNGVVTFSGLKVAGTPGTDYALRYTADWSGTTLTSATSNLFHVSKVATVTLSYATQAYSPNAVVHAAFYTDSPGGITYTSSASALVCELDPGTGDLTIKGAGDCLVRVAVAIDQNGFYLANAAEATLVITKATQAAVNITSPAVVDYWSGLTPVAAGGSGTGAYSLSVVEGSTCRLIGATILPGDAGSWCQITATRAGDTNYLPQTSAVQTIAVRKINQADLAIASANSMTVDSLNLFTSGGSGTGLVSYSLVSAGTAHCSIAGAVLSATSSGTCSIRATKAASINYNVVTSSPQTITVRKDSQTVAFTSTAPMNPIVLGTYIPTATATSALAVSFTVANGSTCAVDNVDPGKITFTSVGLCEIIATQAGSNRYASASVRQFIQVGALNQTINFDVIPDLAFGTPAFKLAPTTNAGTRAVITLATTSNSTACSLVDGIVTLNQAGLCEIVAAQGGYGSYSAASDVVRTFNVLADQAGAPHIFSSSVATHSITASFTPPSYTGGSPITGFVLVATDTAGNNYENAACPIVGSTITCTIVGIPNDVAYTAVVRAITTAGRGAVSNVTMSQTPIDAPMAVTNLTATTSSNDLIVTWTPPIVATGAGVTGYDVYVAPIGEALPATTPYRVNGATASSTTITNLLNQSTSTSATPTPSPSETISPARISFRRASVSSPSPSASNTTPSSSVSAPAGYQVRIVTLIGSIVVASDANTTNGFQTNFSVPLSPSQLTLTVTGNDLMTSWSAPTADGGSPVTGYDVKVNGSIICAATSSLFCEFTGMQPGRTYSVEVLAINAVGSSAGSTASHSVAALPSATGASGGGSLTNGMTILGVSAKTALTNGGQLLTLNARNFAGVTSVTLEGKPVKIISNSEDHITLELPAHEPGTVDLIFKSKIGTLVFQDAVTFIAPPRADTLQTFSRYRTNFVATNAKMVASIKAVVLAKEAPKAMVCVGLVPLKYTANDVKLAKIRAANVCAVGAKLDGNLAVRSTTGITKLTGPAARAVKVTYKY